MPMATHRAGCNGRRFNPERPIMLDLTPIKARVDAITNSLAKPTNSCCWGCTLSYLEKIIEYEDDLQLFKENARTDIPALIAEVERLREELAKAKADNPLNARSSHDVDEFYKD